LTIISLVAVPFAEVAFKRLVSASLFSTRLSVLVAAVLLLVDSGLQILEAP